MPAAEWSEGNGIMESRVVSEAMLREIQHGRRDLLSSSSTRERPWNFKRRKVMRRMLEETSWRTSAAILPKKTMSSWSERCELELQTDSKYTVRTVGPWTKELTSDLVNMEQMPVLKICYQNRMCSLYNPCNSSSRKAPKKESHALKFSGIFSLLDSHSHLSKTLKIVYLSERPVESCAVWSCIFDLKHSAVCEYADASGQMCTEGLSTADIQRACTGSPEWDSIQQWLIGHRSRSPRSCEITHKPESTCTSSNCI